MQEFMCENLNIRKEIKIREQKDDNLFYVNTIIVHSQDGFDIIKKKKFYGVSANGDIILQPIFDEIIILTSSTISAKICDYIALYSSDKKAWITHFKYTLIDKIETYYRLFVDAKSFVLFDTLSNKVLPNINSYDEFNLKQRNTEYCWARKGRFYDFIHRQSWKCISIPAMVMAYDTDCGMFGMDENGTVSLYDKTGRKNNFELRKIVLKEGGYLALFNYTYNIEHVIDVYGNILNH